MRVTLIADGTESVLEVTAQALSVRGLLDAIGLTLDPLDRVEPDLYVQVVDGMRIGVIRVQETFKTERQPLPFVHTTVRSEAVPVGEQRLLQPGTNGEVEITYRVLLEDGVETVREEVRREVLVKPVDETILVGVQGNLAPVPIEGTVAYLSGGNAWIVRESSDLRRNVTGSGDLDGRVFSLSGDGTRLLFTRTMVGEGETPLNSLWMARTSLVGEDPSYLGVTGVVWAEWSPDGTSLAFSTAQRSGGVPGWKANNDLWLLELPEDDSGQEASIHELLPTTAEIPYAWWGRSFVWSPDGRRLAYAQANEVGIVSVSDKELQRLASFPAFRTRSQWAWVPDLSWSPDGYLLAVVIHEGDLDGLAPEDSPVFSLWVISADAKLELRLAEEVGMWASPRWSPTAGSHLIYGQAQSPRNSQDSRYELFVMDRDGSNARRVFPPEGRTLMGVLAPDVAWSPTGDEVLVEYEGDLYRVGLEQGTMDRLTSDGGSSHPRWAP